MSDEGESPVLLADKVRGPSQPPKWEADAKERLRTTVRRLARPLAELLARDANEGDTRHFVTDFLCEGLGFDKYENLTTEYLVKGEFADYGIRLDKQLVAFVEVKRVATKLSTKHLRQVEMYAVNEGVEWMILTSGANWQVYHLTGGLPVQIDLVMDVNLLDGLTPAEKINNLFYLSRESMKRHQMDDLWRAKRATSPKSLAQVLVSDAVADVVRRELKKTTGHSLETSEVIRLLKATVIRPDAMPAQQ